VGACHSPATDFCQIETGLSGEALDECVRGFGELGPEHRNKPCKRLGSEGGPDCALSRSEAEAVCELEKNDCIEILHSKDPEAPPVRADNTCVLNIPLMAAPVMFVEVDGESELNPDWADLANGVVNRYNGCHTGVQGYFDTIEKYSKPLREGCLIRVDRRGFFVCVD
jgi:hypothetical protein